MREPQDASSSTERLRTVSLRRRVSAAVLAVLALLLVGLGLFINVALGRQLRADLNTRLADRAEFAVQLDDDNRDYAEIVERVTGDNVSARIVAPDGTVYGAVPSSADTGLGRDRPRGPRAGRDGGPAPPGPGGPAPPGGTAVQQSGSLRVVQVTLQDGGQLLLAADETQISGTLDRFRLFMVIGGLATLTLAALLLAGVVGLALRPLDTMTGVARSITRGDRGRRLDPDRRETELGRTAVAFDEMLDELEGAECSARAAEARMRELLSDAAHELRTPLAGMQTAAETILRGSPPRAEREKLAVGMVRESQRASRLIADLLAMAEIDRGLTMARTAVNLLDLASHEADRIRLRAPNLAVTVAGDPVIVDGDPQRLAQVLANLVDNARRATSGRGQVTVTVSRDHAAGAGEVLVSDNGPGVPAEQRERIFERLVRLDHARSRDTGGAGLGLSIARGIARAHGGDLRCLPSTAGARFLFTMPTAAPPTPHT